MPRHQRFRQHDVEVVLVVAAFVAHRDHVAKALVVSSAVRAPLRSITALVASVVPWMTMPMSPAATPDGLQDVAHARHHALLGRRRRGQDLDRGAPAVMLEREIGEGAADIDGKSSRRHQSPGLCCSRRAVNLAAPHWWQAASVNHAFRHRLVVAHAVIAERREVQRAVVRRNGSVRRRRGRSLVRAARRVRKSRTRRSGWGCRGSDQ